MRSVGLRLRPQLRVAEHTFRREMFLAIGIRGGFRSIFRRNQMTSESPSRQRSSDRSQRAACPYQCNFCGIELKPVPCCGREYLKRAVLLQTFVCPHCFDHYTRPLAVLGRWSLVKWLLRKPWVSAGKPEPSELIPVRPRLSWLDRFVEFGQVMMRWEAWCMDTIRSGIRRIMAIFNRS